MDKVLLLGNGAREHAIAEALVRSKHSPVLFSFMKANNPGISRLSAKTQIGVYADTDTVVAFALGNKINFAIVGPEEPLAEGVVDALAKKGIPTVGPSKALASLETSKSFTRNLLTKYGIDGNPLYRNFTSMEGVAEFIDTLVKLGGVVVKPDGLTGGKGVMVQGDHFQNGQEAIKICQRFLQEHPSITIEEKLDGEEFSLQCLCDGKTVVATPAVQDHKRRFNGDNGPNTGGMGSYSCPNHLLPFIDEQDIAAGLAITQRVADALWQETGTPYKGVLYAGFMATKNGIKLLEYNARFGDPEAMNILPLLKTDFVEVCSAIINGTLANTPIIFENYATVCKYIVPKGYGLPRNDPRNSYGSTKLTFGDLGKARLYYASVDERADGIHISSSRTIGILGIAERSEEAEKIAQQGVEAIKGEIDHRSDIGTTELIAKRVEHMRSIKNQSC